MKENYTLKLVLAMLVVVLVSLVSFVGVYKGKNLLKEYSLGKDFSQRQVANYTVIVKNESNEENKSETAEDNGEVASENKEEGSETNEEDAENKENVENKEDESGEAEQNEESTENKEEKKEEKNPEKEEKELRKKYTKSKNIIEQRLREMEIGDYDIRLDESNGNLTIEVPSDIDVSYLSQVASKGSVKIMNQSKSEVIADNNDIKSVTARLDKVSYSKPVVILTLKLTNKGKKKFENVETVTVDSEGVESAANFALTVDGQSIYSDEGESFANTVKSGVLELVLGQNEDETEVEKRYSDALALVSIMNNGELEVEYNIEGVDIISANFSFKGMIIIISIVAIVLFLALIAKYNTKAILPMLSLVGLTATILLVLRYTNVKITLFTILGIATVIMQNYVVIYKALGNKKTFGENFIETLNIFIPCFIVSIVFMFAPYIQLASLGMGFFWGIIIMCIYNAVITRVLISKE